MTSISPHDLLADEHLYTAAVDEAERAEWSLLHQLLARNLEVSHALLRVVMGAVGYKQTEIPTPLEVRSPFEREDEKKLVLSPAEAAKWLMGGDG